jgi:tetratricopeptide (TPR) repeat protein
MESDVAYSAKFHEFLAWAEHNRSKLAYGIGAVALVAFVVAFFMWRGHKAEVEAGRALSRVFVPQATAAATGNQGRMRNPEAYLKVASEYPKSMAGARALLLAATDLYLEGKYPEAQAQFERFVREYRQSSFVPEAMLGVAASLEAQGKTEEALTAYRNVVDRYPGQVAVPQAKFALARLYEAQGKLELAQPLFEDVARTEPYTSVGSEAGMRSEELRSRLPKPAAPSPEASSTSLSLTTNTMLLLTNVPAAATDN